MKRFLLVSTSVAAFIAAPLVAQQNRAPAAPAASDEIEILPVHGSIYMIAGAGGNITGSAGEGGGGGGGNRPGGETRAGGGGGGGGCGGGRGGKERRGFPPGGGKTGGRRRKP